MDYYTLWSFPFRKRNELVVLLAAAGGSLVSRPLLHATAQTIRRSRFDPRASWMKSVVRKVGLGQVIVRVHSTKICLPRLFISTPHSLSATDMPIWGRSSRGLCHPTSFIIRVAYKHSLRWYGTCSEMPPPSWLFVLGIIMAAPCCEASDKKQK
jgi:hypothetical protein